MNEESVEYLCDSYWPRALLVIAKRCALLQATEAIGEMNENVASVSVYCLSYKASLSANLF